MAIPKRTGGGARANARSRGNHKGCPYIVYAPKSTHIWINANGCDRETDNDGRRIAPFKTSENPLGVDLLGRDILSRLIHGARNSAFISLISLGFGALVMRVCDGVTGFPTILLALIIVAIRGGAGISKGVSPPGVALFPFCGANGT